MKINLRYILYASPAFAFAIPTFPVMIFLPAFYTESLGVPVAKVGLFLFVAKLIDILTDPFVGWLNDRRILSRKFLIIIGSVISAISLFKLFLITEIPYEEYLLLWIGLLYLGWTMFQIPYLSIGYDLEKNYFLRTKLSATREFFILIGLFCSLCIPIFLNISNHELLQNIVFLAICSGFLGLLIFCIFIPDKRIKTEKNESFLISLKNISKNKPLIRILAILFINSIANVFPMILFAFFITYVLGGDDFNRQLTLFYYFLFALLGIPFWTLISKKIGKKKTWSLSLILSAIFFILVFFVQKGDFSYFIVISCITGFCLGADLIIPPSIQADLTDIHKNKFKEDISGVMFSFITFINKFSFAIVSIFVFGIMGLLNFDVKETVTKEIELFIITSYAFVPIILKIFAGYLLSKYQLKETDLKKIQKNLYG